MNNYKLIVIDIEVRYDIAADRARCRADKRKKTASN